MYRTLENKSSTECGTRLSGGFTPRFVGLSGAGKTTVGEIPKPMAQWRPR